MICLPSPPTVLEVAPVRLTAAPGFLDSTLIIMNSASPSTSTKGTAVAITVSHGTASGHQRLMEATSEDQFPGPRHKARGGGFPGGAETLRTTLRMNNQEGVADQQTPDSAYGHQRLLDTTYEAVLMNKPDDKHTYTKKFAQGKVPGSLEWPSNKTSSCPSFLRSFSLRLGTLNLHKQMRVHALQV